MTESRLRGIEAFMERYPLLSMRRECGELIAEVKRLRDERDQWERDYESVRDAVLMELAEFAHDGDEAEPFIVAEAVTDASVEIVRLRAEVRRLRAENAGLLERIEGLQVAVATYQDGGLAEHFCRVVKERNDALRENAELLRENKVLAGCDDLLAE